MFTTNLVEVDEEDEARRLNNEARETRRWNNEARRRNMNNSYEHWVDFYERLEKKLGISIPRPSPSLSSKRSSEKTQSSSSSIRSSPSSSNYSSSTRRSSSFNLRVPENNLVPLKNESNKNNFTGRFGINRKKIINLGTNDENRLG